MRSTSDRPFVGAGASPFGRRQRRPRGACIPVILVTGFLGAGKTTLIRHLLGTPEGRDTAVVVNEFGEIGVDDALLADAAETVALIGDGCLCCTVRSDLELVLRRLAAERERGNTPRFRRVILETSGLADPGPMLLTFVSDRALGRIYHLDAVVTVVDAVCGATALTALPEARRQVVLADRILIAKTDIARPDAVAALEGDLRALNPRARIARAVAGHVDPSLLLDDADGAAFASGLLAEDAAHTPEIESFGLFFDHPFRWPVLSRALDTLTALRGGDILRAKGLIAVEGCRGPVVVHLVQHVVHPPVELERWPGADRRSRLVLITRGLGREPVQALFEAVRRLVL